MVVHFAVTVEPTMRRSLVSPTHRQVRPVATSRSGSYHPCPSATTGTPAGCTSNCSRKMGRPVVAPPAATISGTYPCIGMAPDGRIAIYSSSGCYLTKEEFAVFLERYLELLKESE